MKPSTQVRHYPEAAAGGFSRVDGTVAFFNRIHALLTPDAVVLEFGAGRGADLHDDPVPYRRRLRQLRGACARVIAADIDPVVLENPFVDEAHVLDGPKLPLADASVDMIVSDHTFEHLDDPAASAAEFHRVLKPGGWICARTPNRWSYVGLAVNAIPNSLHVRLLKTLQPGRKAVDVFPTRYRVNSFGALKARFPKSKWLHASYAADAEPVYVGSVGVLWWLVRLFQRLTPRPFRTVLFVFLQKR